MEMDLNEIRREYTLCGLHRDDLDDDPIGQFNKWLKQAVDAGIKDPTAMSVATVDSSGQPSQRIVLLKQVDQSGFSFYTNYGSHKARDISANPLVSLHFPWHVLERQVKIRGRAEKMTRTESLKYFATRPEDSQLAAWASEQSQPVSSRQLLMQQFESMKEKFREGKIPLPDFWGGYRVVPNTIEFWQGGLNRIHDRFEYTRKERNWVIKRLAP